MGSRHRRKVGESQHITTLRNWVKTMCADAVGYVTGGLEQLMAEVGKVMSVQAGIIEYLEEQSTKRRDDVGAELRIRSIIEQNIAKAKAERAAAEAAKLAAQETEAPANIVPAPPADEAPALTPGDA